MATPQSSIDKRGRAAYESAPAVRVATGCLSRGSIRYPVKLVSQFLLMLHALELSTYLDNAPKWRNRAELPGAI